jgi:hypothetical protein
MFTGYSLSIATPVQAGRSRRPPKDFTILRSAASPPSLDSAPLRTPKTLPPAPGEPATKIESLRRLRRYNLPESHRTHRHTNRAVLRPSQFLLTAPKPVSSSAARQPPYLGEAASQPQVLLREKEIEREMGSGARHERRPAKFDALWWHLGIGR